jgi:hypothetical protein
MVPLVIGNASGRVLSPSVPVLSLPFFSSPLFQIDPVRIIIVVFLVCVVFSACSVLFILLKQAIRLIHLSLGFLSPGFPTFSILYRSPLV